MPCTYYSRKKELHYQPIPMTGRNYGINKLRQSLNSADLSAPIYCYVMTTIRNYDGTLQHIGSGPNWQGGIITLCTCKHLMRTYPDIKKDTWIAGFSTVCACDDGRNHLMYLMRVGQTYKSHYALWYFLPEEVREVKATDMNPLGDVCRPLGKDTRKAPFDPAKYRKPCRDHSHRDCSKWHEDIKYTTKKDKHPLLCVGDEDYSFVWDQSMIILDHSIGRGQRKLCLSEFLSHLQDVE